jgi:hypothetical protein
MDPLTPSAADKRFGGTLRPGEAGDRLEQFIQTELRTRKAEIEEIKDLIGRVLKVFTWSFVEGGGWPYQVVNAKPLEEPRGFSFSTAAMIGFSLGLATGRIRESSLVPSVRSLPALTTDETANALKSVLSRTLDLLISKSGALEEEWKRSRREKAYPKPSYEPPRSESGTFGWDDPFTLTWLLELLSAETNSDREKFRAQLEERAWYIVQPVLRDPQAGFLQVEADEEVSHAFQLLRVVQLVQTLQRISGGGRRRRRPDLSRMRTYLLQRVHLRLSESRIQESDFDAADLVFSLEGSMLARVASWILRSSTPSFGFWQNVSYQAPTGVLFGRSSRPAQGSSCFRRASKSRTRCFAFAILRRSTAKRTSQIMSRYSTFTRSGFARVFFAASLGSHSAHS